MEIQMPNFELNDEEFETLKDIFSDHGSDCPFTNSEKLQALGEKLGILQPTPPPTEEELKRREEFRNSPYGLMMSKLFKQSNASLAKMLIEQQRGNAFISSVQWGEGGAKIGTTLKIRLPNDYLVK